MPIIIAVLVIIFLLGKCMFGGDSSGEGGGSSISKQQASPASNQYGCKNILKVGRGSYTLKINGSAQEFTNAEQSVKTAQNEIDGEKLCIDYTGNAFTQDENEIKRAIQKYKIKTKTIER